ncbi:MAG: Wzz/FepE/Etk N-terminal domain-containing protein, partial [Betaproteobacteria bacterium]
MSETSTATETATTRDDDEISLLDIAIVLAKHKKLILGLPLIAAVIAAGISLLLPNIYTGTARILPPQQSQSSSAAALIGSLGGLAGLAGGQLGIKNPADLYVGMLKSRTVADKLISRFELKSLYESKTLDDARRVLGDNTRISAGKDGFITVEFDDTDPKRAAVVANSYVEELDHLT